MNAKNFHQISTARQNIQMEMFKFTDKLVSALGERCMCCWIRGFADCPLRDASPQSGTFLIFFSFTLVWKDIVWNHPIFPWHLMLHLLTRHRWTSTHTHRLQDSGESPGYVFYWRFSHFPCLRYHFFLSRYIYKTIFSQSLAALWFLMSFFLCDHVFMPFVLQPPHP
jgi:hypothetical protein